MENNYGLDELHSEILEILCDIDRVCRNNDIKYSLYAGTMIGAIRHKGFIPWDDDADLVFEREEYDKFLSVYPYEKGNNIYIDSNFWVSKVRKDDQGNNNTRLCCFVDLLVFDNVPNSKVKTGLKNLALKILQGTLKGKVDYKKYTLTEKILISGTQIIGLFFKRKWKLAKYDSISRIGNNETGKKIRVYNGPFIWLKHSLPKTVIDEYYDVYFEGKQLMIIGAFDGVLKSLYGDYMIPPPMEERVPKHFTILSEDVETQ